MHNTSGRSGSGQGTINAKKAHLSDKGWKEAQAREEFDTVVDGKSGTYASSCKFDL